MDIRVLRNFIQIARDESLTKASKKLHISQPALSRQMKELEEELNVKLFNRSSYAIHLTREGVRLLQRAEDIVSMADQTLREFSEKQDTISGDIRIGASEGESVRILGKCMKHIKKLYPDIFYHMYTGDTEMLREKLDNGFLDFLAISENPDTSMYQSIKLPIRDRWGLVIPTDDPLSQKKEITRDDLMHLDLIVSRQALHQDLPAFFEDKTHRLRIIATYDLAHNSTLLAKEGVGYVLCFDHLADISTDSGLVFRAISPPLYTDMHLIYRKHQMFSKPAERFLTSFKEIMEEMEK